MPTAGRAISWPQPHVVELVDTAQVTATHDEAVVEVAVSVSNPGTERARYLALPTASIGFPHVPGIGAAGHVIEPAAGVDFGDLVAVRCGPHQSVIRAPVSRMRSLPHGTNLIDAALWQVGLIGMHGLGMGGYVAGEPITVVGAGLVGAATRRVAQARGTVECRVIAMSRAKNWSVLRERGTEFLSATQVSNQTRRHSLVVDATGTATGLAIAVALAGDGGRVVLLGSPRAPTGVVPVREIYDRELRIVGAHIDTLPDASAHTGVDLLAAYTSEYFSLINAGGFGLADLVTVYTPHQAPVLYRQLIDDRSLVGVAVAWPATPLERAAEMPPARVSEPRQLRFGIIGCGDIGFQDAEAIRRAAGAKLVACFDTNRELSQEVAGRASVRAAESVSDILGDPEIDAVLVATPHDTHEQVASAVLHSRKHLLLQKPLSTDLPSARRIVRTAHQAPCTASLLLPGRYTAAYRAARRALDDGTIGEAAGIVATYLVNKPSSYYCAGYSGRSVSSWRLSKTRSGGGVLITNLLHHLDIAQSLLGTSPDWVFARTLPSLHSPEIEDVAAVMIGYGEAVATFVGAASVPGAPGEHFRLWGTAGQCVLLPAWQLVSSPESASAVGMRPEPADPPTAAINAFVEAVHIGRPPDVTMEDALTLQATLAAAYESAQTGRLVHLAELLAEAP